MPSKTGSYLTQNVPQSVRTVLETLSQDRVATIVKNAWANYINNFFNTTGVNRTLAQQLGTNTLQYVTDLSLPTDFKGAIDPSFRQMQLAKFTEDTTEKLPQIIILDSQLEWLPSGLGQRESSEYIDSDRRVDSFAFIFQVPIKTLVMTTDEATTKDLTNLIVLMSGPLQNVAGGNRIESSDPKSHWVVTLPIHFDPATYTRMAAPEDKLDQIWIGEMNITLRYEAKVSLNIIENTIVPPLNAMVDQPTLDVTPIIGLTGNLKVGQQVDVDGQFMLEADRMFVSNINDMTVQWTQLNPAKVRIIANRPGTFAIIIQDRADNIKAQQTYQVTL